MKLAQALTERADIQKRIEQLKYRLFANARVQDGETPAEDPVKLLNELSELTDALETLITRINLTNSNITDDGQSLTALLAKRDCLALKTAALREFLNEASSITMRATRSEIKIKSTVDVEKVQKQVDELSCQLRQLDVRIQSLNWTNELK